MPKGPKGQKRPADVIGNAVRVMQIATGEAEDESPSPKAIQAGVKGGTARASKLSKEERKKIARKAANARWKKNSGSKR